MPAAGAKSGEWAWSLWSTTNDIKMETQFIQPIFFFVIFFFSEFRKKKNYEKGQLKVHKFFNRMKMSIK